MANNYEQFSEVLVLSKEPEAREREAAWLKEVLSLDFEDMDFEARLKALDVSIVLDSCYCWPDFEYRIDSDEAWFYSEESFSIDNLAAVVQAFLMKFEPDEHWTMTWAATCSKPRAGEFGGGAMLVTAKRVVVKSTYELLREMKLKEGVE